jgi:hypothetical protein
MAIDKTIKINVDGSDAIKDLKKVSSEVDATFADLRKTTPITLDGTKAKKVLGDVDSKVGEVKRGAQEIGVAAEGSAKGFNVMNISVKAVAASLKAAGIGLVVTALVKLGEALGKNQVFMDKFNIVTETISITFQKLVNTLVDATLKVGNFFSKVGGVIKKFIGQDLDGLQNGLEGTDGATKKVGKSTKDLATEIVNLRNEVKLAEAQQRLLQLTFQKDAEIQRQIRDDVSLTIEERIKANNKLKTILDEQFAAEKLLAERKLELAKKEAAQNEKNIDLQVAVINAQAELADLEERITGQRSENKVNAVALEQELLEDQKKLGEQEEVILLKKVGNTVAGEEKMRKEAKKTFELRKELAQAEMDSEQEIADRKFDLANQQVDQAQAMLQSLADIAQENLTAEKNALQEQLDQGLISQEVFDEQSAEIEEEALKREKRNALLQILINTGQGIAGAIKAGAGVPFPANLFAIATGVGTVLAGIASAKSILNKVPLGDGGGDDGGTESVDITAPGGIGGNLIPDMNAITPPDTGIQPVQAYVVENDISDAQALQEELDIQATL